MEKTAAGFRFSATDLVGYLNCRHLSALDRATADGILAKPTSRDPLLQVLWDRGAIHEQNYVEHLKQKGLDPIRIDGVDVSEKAVASTVGAMTNGAAVIVQGALANNHSAGRADILRRVERPSVFGNWSYEVIDTKLARKTKAGTVLQLCLYSDLLQHVQETPPENMYVVVPWSEFEPQLYRFADYGAYYRLVKRRLERALEGPQPADTYPDPKEHCDVCRWSTTCDKRRRDDDHLCLVAGISKVQINELKQRGAETVKDLASLPLPLEWKPECPSSEFLGQGAA